MAENQGHLPLAPEVPALPGKGQVTATKAQPSVTRWLSASPQTNGTSNLLSPPDRGDLRLPSTRGCDPVPDELHGVSEEDAL